MARLHFTVGVVYVKRKLQSKWVPYQLAAHSIMPIPAQVSLDTFLGKVGDDELYYGGSHELSFYSGETGHYRDNFASHTPSVWVSVRENGLLAEVTKVTVDPYEGEALVTNNIDEVVEKLPLPEIILEEMMAFFEAHHVETEFIKRKRNKFKGGQFEGKLDA